MSVEEAVVQKLRALPPDKQQRVLEFAESLGKENGDRPLRRSLKGALSHLDIRLTEDDIRQARREIWRGYVHEDAD